MADELQENLATYKLQLQQVKTEIMWLNDYECFVNTLCANDRVELDRIEYNSDLAEIFVKRYGVIGQISTQG